MKNPLIIALLPLLLWSCISDGMPPLPDDHIEDAPYVVIRLAVPSISSATRANPMGGEEGNGREKALPGEDRIHDINVFFYNEKDEENPKGLDGADDTSIFHTIYFNLDDLSDPANARLIPNVEESHYFDATYYELKFKTTENLPDLKEGTNFAVIANIGESKKGISTLGELRALDLSDYRSCRSSSVGETATVQTSKGNMDHFLMSTSFNKDYKDQYGYSTGSNSLSKQKDIYTGTTTLQRLAARIDLWYNARENAGIEDNNNYVPAEWLKYDVEGHEDDCVILLNTLPVNVMQTPSFLFKKVSSEELTAWTNSDLSEVDSFLWAGKETPQAVSTSKPEDCPTNYVFERHTLAKVPTGSSVAETDLTSWYGDTRISSVKENIKSKDKGKMKEYPAMKCLKGPHDPDYKCDRISIIGYADENVHPTDCFRPEYITGLAFRALYVPKVIVKDIDESSGELIAMIDADVSAFDIKKKLYHYSATAGRNQEEGAKDLVFADQEIANKYLAKHPKDNAIVTEFGADRVDGKLGLECFYSLWLRHYNDEKADPQSVYPMEYAIVRNNIYRVALFFSGPGTPKPEMREPDTMTSRIFVRKWNLREESSPMLF